MPVHCPDCGSQLSFRGRQVACTACNYSRNLQQNSDHVVPRSLEANVSFKDFKRSLGRDLHEYTCEDCQTHLVSTHAEKTAPCPFCQGKLVPAEEIFHEKRLLPEGIIPFTIPQKKASRLLHKWLRKRYFYFLPRKIFRLTQPENLKGVFLPYFLIDAHTRSTWKGNAGIQYTAKVKVKGKERNEQRIAWEPTAGYWEHYFADISVPASQGINAQYLEEIEPFQFRKIVDYDPRYLSDWFAELYQAQEMDGVKTADALIDLKVMQHAYGRVKGDEVKDFKIVSEKSCLSFRHIFMPIWLATFVYRGRPFQFLINGQTGQITGDKPLSFPRMYIAIGIVVLLLVILGLYQIFR